MDKCLVCNNLFESGRKIKAKKYFYDVCKVCHSGILKPRSQVLKESQKEYQKNEYFDWGTLPTVKNWLYNVQFYKSYLNWISTYVAKKGKIIDIGAGVTTFVREMVNNRWDTYAQEISKKQSKIISQVLKKGHVFNGDFEKMKLPASFFDVATMWHVLEHVKEPVQTATRLNKILKKNGKVFIEVPNIDSVNWYLFNDEYNLLDVPVHLFYFSETGLRKLFENQGFKVLEISQPFKFNSSFSVSLERFMKSKGLTSFLARVFFYISLPISLLVNLVACFMKKGEVIRVVALKV